MCVRAKKHKYYLPRPRAMRLRPKQQLKLRGSQHSRVMDTVSYCSGWGWGDIGFLGGFSVALAPFFVASRQMRGFSFSIFAGKEGGWWADRNRLLSNSK
jgi:hypothetical protein